MGIPIGQHGILSTIHVCIWAKSETHLGKKDKEKTRREMQTYGITSRFGVGINVNNLGDLN